MNPAPASSHLDTALVALADPTRRAILRRLARGNATVTELAEPFTISLNAVSKHIQMLERARLVERHRAGREHVLSFNPSPLEDVAAWIQNQRASWMARLDALDALLKAEDRARSQSHRKRTKGRSR